MITSIPRVCGSVAGSPSALGVALHNAGYQGNGLSYTYLAMGTDSIDEALRVAKMLGFRGLGVSMPHKVTVIDHLDAVGDDVQAIGACNTVVFSDDRLAGHNTDWIGARDSLKEVGVHSPHVALVVGAGGAARAIAYALVQLGAEVYVAARRKEAAAKLVSDLGLAGSLGVNEQATVRADLVVNATPDATTSSPLRLAEHSNATALFDVVFTQIETPLAVEAKRRGLVVAPGWRMLLHQALEQFRLYTETEPPIDAMASVLEHALSSRAK